MTFSLKDWKEQFTEKLSGWKQQMQAAGVKSVYGFLSASALGPVIHTVQSGQFFPAISALGGITVALGTNLLASELESWKDSVENTVELAVQLEKKAAESTEFRDELDEVLQKLDALQTALQLLAEEDKPWFLQQMKDELQKLGNLPTFEAFLSGSGAIVRGDRTVAAGERGIVTGGDVLGGVQISGDNNQVSLGNFQTDTNTKDSIDAQFAIARTRYLRNLIQHCQTLPLAALGENVTLKEEITLDRVYVGLDTTQMQRLTEVERRTLSQKYGYEVEKDSERPVTALEVAEQYSRLVLLGDPGAGKSTFVKQLCVQLAGILLKSNEKNAVLPMFINLRDLAARLNPFDLKKLSAKNRTIELQRLMVEQMQYSFKELNSVDFGKTFLNELKSSNSLLVLDGLDEVPIEKRESMRELVADSCAYFGFQKVLITCRIRSYSDASRFEGFTAYTLAPFNAEKISNFIRGWYLAQQGMGRILQGKVEKKIENLTKAALEGSLKEIAGNPMLLTTMSIIHQREIGLPDRQVELYKLAVELLLHRWREHQAGESLNLSTELNAFLSDDQRLMPVLERLAFEAHIVASEEGESGDLKRMTALELLEDEANIEDLNFAKEFLDYIDQHSGLLIGKGGEVGKPLFYGFPHRTFQEYLAGCYLVSRRDIARNILPLAKQGEYWATAVRLGFEELLYNRRSENTLLDLAYQFCPSAGSQSVAIERQQLWSSNIAVLLGEEKIKADNSQQKGGQVYLNRIRSVLIKRLNGKLPPIERAQAGRNLAELGDPRDEITTIEKMPFCLVPAGPFWMGANKKDVQAFSYEKPLHHVEINHDYWLAKYPVSNKQFQVFINDGGYANKNFWQEAIAAQAWDNGRIKTRSWDGQKNISNYFSDKPFGYGKPFNLDNHPFVGGCWYEALAYCRWLTRYWKQKKLLPAGWEVSLPTESEWEKAVRGGIKTPDAKHVFTVESLELPRSLKLVKNLFPQRNYPWGDENITGNFANYIESGIGLTSTAESFRMNVSLYGNVDMVGNVWEWCQSKWRNDYMEEANEELDSSGDYRVLRGGSWGAAEYGLRCSARNYELPDIRYDFIGFRIGLFPVSGSG